MNVELTLPQMAWENHLAALAAGDADIAAGATESEARSRYAYFSKPYRTETDVLILPRGASGRYAFRTIEEMLDTFTKQKFRPGIVAGFVYADQRVNAFIADPANRDRIFAVESEVQNLRNLQDGIIDGFIADRIAATTAAWRRNAGSLIEEHPLRFTMWMPALDIDPCDCDWSPLPSENAQESPQQRQSAARKAEHTQHLETRQSEALTQRSL